jgi:hypothetical protein
MCAGHRDLDNLVAVIDRNSLQQGARTEAIAIGLAEAGAGNALFDLGASRDGKTPRRRSPTGVGRCPKPTRPACTDAIGYGARALPTGY